MYFRCILLGLVLGSCGTASSPTPSPTPSQQESPTVASIKELPSEQALWRQATPEEEQNASIPSALRVSLEGEPVLKGRKVVLTASLHNSSDQDLQVVIFPVHDRTPFYLQVMVTENLARKPHEGPPLPPAPPNGRVLTVPAQTKLLFQESIDFDDYNARTFQGAEIRWSFQFWAEPKPGGVVTLSDELTSAL